jgi:flagellar basal body-associated protein FliL
MPDQPAGPREPMTFTPPAQPKKGRGKLVVLIAVIVFVALAAAVVYVYLKGRQPATTAPIGREAPTVTTTDVDSTSQAITTQLSKVSDSKDFSSSDLSDQSLGL